MLDRLIGLETEYATLVQPPADQARPPSRMEVYRAIQKQITRRLPTARGRYDTDTIFLANGGAFSIESCPTRYEQPGGLIEGATAEVRSPSQVLQCQRAQDRLIAEAAQHCGIPGRVRVIKNSCDVNGHIYGCQENYSASVANGIGLWFYWGMLCLVVPLALFYWVVCLTVLGLELALYIVHEATRTLRLRLGRIFARAFSCFARNSVGKGLTQRLSHETGEEGGQAEAGSWHFPLPCWLIAATAKCLRFVSFPAAAMLYLTVRTVAFRQQQKYLTAFLVSRVVVTGAGHVDRHDRFRLSSKAMATGSVTGLGGVLGDRPIFVFHHWLQQLCGRSLLSRRSLIELFYPRQRLQIGLSDSNVSDTAEYLKVGATSLVLDMIEAGWTEGLPRLAKPLPALHRIASDWELISRVPTSRGELSGLEIQKVYFRACSRFVAAQNVRDDHEAWTVLRRWEEALEALGSFRSKAIDPRPSLGHIDWLTKKWILDHLPEGTQPEGTQPGSRPAASGGQATPVSERDPDCTKCGKEGRRRWALRKKIDIRYHELSEDGYFSRLREHSPELSGVDEQAIQLAIRLPPTGSPAARRGQIIREFSSGPEPLAVDWSHVIIGTGKQRRVVSIHHWR